MSAETARGECGLMTLEWLLIVAAIAGLAAGSVLAVQQVVDESTDRPPRPEVREVDAEIAAAEVAYEATQQRGESPNPPQNYDDSGFEQRCMAVSDRFADVIVPPSDWDTPTADMPAKCKLERRDP